MQLFLYEYTTATGQDVPHSLQAEGRGMLAALVTDFSRIAGVNVAVLNPPYANEEHRFRELARKSDYTMVIAPEFDDILQSRCRWVLDVGGRLLGPTLEAIQLCADKLTLAEYLAQRGIPTPKTYSVTNIRQTGLWVQKPRYGAGSIATFLLSGAECHAEGWHGENIVQPYVAGQSASVAFLIGPHARMALPACTQILSNDGRFRYLGGAVPLAEPLANRAVSLATRAVDSVPGLAGYIGVDLVLGDSDDWIIEINPRMTTSYIGLRRLAKSNLAEAMLRIMNGESVAPIEWRSGPIQFSPMDV